MTKIEGISREVFDKTEWFAIATCGNDGPHVVGTWGDYVRTMGLGDDQVIVIPVATMKITEENLKKDTRVEVLIASQQVNGEYGPGQGCSLTGKAEIQTSGELAEGVKKEFSWARGALIIKVEQVKTLL
jgi:hypothetical protein